jgi:hypothetical protein
LQTPSYRMYHSVIGMLRMHLGYTKHFEWFNILSFSESNSINFDGALDEFIWTNLTSLMKMASWFRGESMSFLFLPFRYWKRNASFSIYQTNWRWSHSSNIRVIPRKLANRIAF